MRLLLALEENGRYPDGEESLLAFIAQTQLELAGQVMEAANGYRDFKEYDPFRLRRSVGVGARFYLRCRCSVSLWHRIG